MKNKKALIAMSGGIDSSVAASLMVERGYDCIGVTMKLYNNEDIGIDREKTCCSLDDIEDARSVARRLNMPYYVFNFSDDFDTKVIRRFINAYENGATPNPCIDCNRFIKFERLFHRAEELGCDKIVTGHYAVVEYDDKTGRYMLRKPADNRKDQTYVLYSLTQEQLAHMEFPLGSMRKSQAREYARERGFINASKPDSQDICFVPDGDYAKFIENYTGKKYPCGNFIDRDGNVIGEHRGIIRYTIGQRRGLGLPLQKAMYVCEKCLDTNEVILGADEDLFTSSLTATDVNLISCARIEGEMRVKAKVRYRQAAQWATVTQPEDDIIKIEFDEPQRAITKGQAVVMYDGDYVVGGGTIQ